MKVDDLSFITGKYKKVKGTDTSRYYRKIKK